MIALSKVITPSPSLSGDILTVLEEGKEMAVVRGCPETKALKNKILCHVLGKTKNGITGSASRVMLLAR
jgi:hypothetical protein